VAIVGSCSQSLVQELLRRLLIRAKAKKAKAHAAKAKADWSVSDMWR